MGILLLDAVENGCQCSLTLEVKYERSLFDWRESSTDDWALLFEYIDRDKSDPTLWRYH
jgi:hypothetical protein